ncbi:MAG: MFS transporter, partial [Carbonactinosporaceae bacterium]
MAGEAQAATPTAPSPWRDRRFVIFAAGNLTNNIGDAIYAVALPLLVYELTGSLAVMSLLAALAPATLLCGPLLGAVADRFGARALVVPGLIVQLVAAFLLNLSATGEKAPLWALTLFGALIQIGGAAYRQGWMSGIPTMFPSNAVRTRGTLGSLYVASTIIGPAIVGVGLSWLGYLGLLWLNLATFVAPIVVWWLGIHPPPPVARTDPGGFRIHHEVAEGWRIIRAHRRFFQCTMMVLPIDFISSIGTLTLATFYLRDRWHVPADDVGTIFT